MRFNLPELIQVTIVEQLTRIRGHSPISRPLHSRESDFDGFNDHDFAFVYPLLKLT
jgi:hypothetical protein